MEFYYDSLGYKKFIKSIAQNKTIILRLNLLDFISLWNNIYL